MKLETQMQVAKNLRTLRTSKCLTQAKIAEMVNITRAMYSSYELGNRTPDAEVLFKIACRFGMSMSAFFEADHYKFLNILSKCELYDDELLELVTNYKSLSSFAKGMLVERAVWLTEWDKIMDSNRKALEEKRPGND